MFGSSTESQDRLFSGCCSSEIKVTSIPGKGRCLFAQQNFEAGQRILSAPINYFVDVPALEKVSVREDVIDVVDQVKPTGDCRFDTAASAAAAARRRLWRKQVLERDYADVSMLHAKYNDPWPPWAYWAALMSLVQKEVPHDCHWPVLSNEMQDNLLCVFQPPCVLSHNLDKEHGVLAPHVCEHFGLGVAPEKVVALVKVWKYNGHEATSILGNKSLSLHVPVCLINHSCKPNSFLRRRHNRPAEIIAKRNVADGEEITINYLGDEQNRFTSETKVRRQLLALTWLFFCTCVECSEVAAPTCPQCNGRMNVVVSKVEAEVCPGGVAECHACSRSDIQRGLGCFFHCCSCKVNLCEYFK